MGNVGGLTRRSFGERGGREWRVSRGGRWRRRRRERGGWSCGGRSGNRLSFRILKLPTASLLPIGNPPFPSFLHSFISSFLHFLISSSGCVSFTLLFSSSFFGHIHYWGSDTWQFIYLFYLLYICKIDVLLFFF